MPLKRQQKGACFSAASAPVSGVDTLKRRSRCDGVGPPREAAPPSAMAARGADLMTTALIFLSAGEGKKRTDSLPHLSTDKGNYVRAAKSLQHDATSLSRDYWVISCGFLARHTHLGLFLLKDCLIMATFGYRPATITALISFSLSGEERKKFH